MLPFIQWTQFHIGPVPIQVWGLFVALGIALGLWVSVRVARARSLNTDAVMDIGLWSIASALIGARLFYALTEWQEYSGHWIDALRVWEGGMSITGGFLGALVGALVTMKLKKLSYLDYSDAIIVGLPVGLWIGRLGCFFIFDHPGTPTQFILGQLYLDGVVRHNHGLYLSLNGLVLSIIFYWCWKHRERLFNGFFLVFFLLWYGVVRFLLDFLRASDLGYSDSRFFGLTAAQYGAMAMVVFGAWIWYALKRK